jgi:hypothetical protein
MKDLPNPHGALGRNAHQPWAVAAGLGAVALILLLAEPALAHGVPESEKQALIKGGPFAYMLSGGIHMITGYDHLLFLFGVMFFLTRFGQIVKFITAFTVGHSITLIAATLLGIKANAYLIDAVIALSVIYIGFNNLDGFRKWAGFEPPKLVWMVFGFGFILGFGLSTQLQELPLPDQGLLIRIITFNVGVEVGQIAALVVMTAVLAIFRQFKSFDIFARLANAFLMVAGALLFLMQLHGYMHQIGADEFPINRHDHKDIHDRQDKSKDGAKDKRDTLMPAE